MRLAAVTVTYRPEPELLSRQWRALPPQTMRIAVDNASPEVAALRALAAEHDVRLIEHRDNLGLAAACNRGMAEADAAGATHVLLLDQDSVPEPGSIAALAAAFEGLLREGRNPGMVGPALRDPHTGLEHGFHVVRGGLWRRVHAAPGAAPLAVASVNGSGSLFALQRVRELGGLDEAFFIDHVDTEWSFRVAAAGHGLYAVPAARFEHRMGERSLRFWLFGWRLWPYRSPLRHAYLFRNAMRLLRRPYVPPAWKASAVVKLAATFAVHLVFDAQRVPQARAMLSGAWQGWRRP